MPKFLSFLIFLFAATTALAYDDVDTLSKKIEDGISVGAPKSDVEIFLSGTGWNYTFDRFSNRYQAAPPENSAKCKDRNFLLWLLYDCDIFILIMFDESGLYKEYSVEQIYTGL